MLLRAALPVLALALGACAAQRDLTISSDPPGAEVRLDEEHVGFTPVTVAFTHYGQRRVTLYLDGYLSSSEVIDLEPPWYGRFPIDIFSEVLFPIGWKQHEEHHVLLERGSGKIPAPDLRDVLDRAEAMRRAGPEGPRTAGGKEERP
jgi:hypothetical protein